MEIILKPVVTEKMTDISDKLNQYGFVVQKSSNKLEIKEAVEKLYGVTVTRVNTIRYAGKKKSRNTKAGVVSGRTSAFKKAFITIKEGDVIDLYSNI